MKLSITQIVLGVLIVAAACYVAWWMISGVEDLLGISIRNTYFVFMPAVTPVNDTLFTISRYLAGLLPVLGLLISLVGAFWNKVKNKKKLAVTQVIAGVLTAAVSIFIMLGGCTFDYIIPVEGGLALNVAYTIWVTIFTALLGMAVFGTGVAQYVKAGRVHA